MAEEEAPSFDVMMVAKQNAELTRLLEKAQSKLEKITAEANSHKEELAKVRLDQRLGTIGTALASQMHLSRIAVDAIVRQYHGEVADVEDAAEAATKLSESLKAKDASLFRPVQADVTNQGSLAKAPPLKVVAGYDSFTVRAKKA